MMKKRGGVPGRESKLSIRERSWKPRPVGTCWGEPLIPHLRSPENPRGKKFSSGKNERERKMMDESVAHHYIIEGSTINYPNHSEKPSKCEKGQEF